MAEFDYLIVGGGNSAGYACKEFVAQNVEGKVGMIMAEPVAPYERPALTKAYLHPPSAKVRARLPGFHTCVGGGGERQVPDWYDAKGIELIKGKAESVDLEAKSVKVGDAEYKYGKLLLATGCTAIRVSQFGVKGDDLPGVFYVREEAETAQLVKALEGFEGKGKAVIVGGGYIGLECAAALVGWGLEVTMVFPEAHCMPRLFNAELAAWLESQYADRKIKLMKGDTAVEFEGSSDGVTGVKLKSGATLEANVVIVGVGARPVVDYCQGLEMEKGGFKVNGFMQTSNEHVYAIGDIAAFPSQYGDMTRCEHVDHARKSAAQAVQAAMGENPSEYKYLPYFYSRIFEYSEAPIVFNFFGSEAGECQVCPWRETGIAAIWAKDGKVTGALLMGSPGPSPEDQGKLREAVSTPKEAGDTAAFFGAAGL